jgi:hypothetical protein
VSPEEKPTGAHFLTVLFLAAMAAGYTSVEIRELALVAALLVAVLPSKGSR